MLVGAGQGAGIDAVAVAVAQVDHAVVGHQVAGTDAGQILALVLRVPLVGGAQGPAVVDHVVAVGDPGRLALFHRRAAGGDGHPRLIEVLDLADRGRETFLAGGLVDEPGTHRQGQLVGVVLAVGACIARVAEQLAPAEGEVTRIEDRQLVLVAVRRAQVEQTRFQGLQEGLAADTGLAVEEQAGVDAADRQAAAGRGIAAQLLGRGRGRVDALRTQDLGLDASHTIHQATVQLIGGVAVGQGRGHIPGRAADRE